MTGIRLAALASVTTLGLAGAALAADISPVVAYPPAPSPIYAPTPIAMGYAELSFGWIASDVTEHYSIDSDDGDEYDLNGISGAGYANIPFANGWNFELEARGSSVYDPGNETVLSQVGGYGHLYWRDPAKWAAGAFGGYNNLGLFSSALNLWTLGVEGLYFWNALTLYGQAGYHWLSADYGDDIGAFFVRAAARYFIQENLKLQGDVLWTSFDEEGDANILTLVGTVEYRLPTVPLSGFASLRWDRFEGDFRDIESTAVLIGIRGYLGSGSLLDNDRNGAPLDVLPFTVLDLGRRLNP